MRLRHVLALALLGAAGSAHAQRLNVVSAVAVEDAGSAVVLSVRGTKPPNFTTFSMADPPRFVIDLSEARFEGVPEEIPVDDGTIRVVKNLSYGSDASSIVRIMVAFSGEVEPPEVVTQGSDLFVRVAKPAGGAAVAQERRQPAAAEPPASRAEPAAAQAEAERVRQEEAERAAEAARRQEEAAAQAEAERVRQEEAERAAEAARRQEDAAAQAEAERARQEEAERTAGAARRQEEAAAQAEAERARQEEAERAAEAARQREEAIAEATAETEPDAALAPDGPPAQLREVGFRQLSGASRVFVRTSAPPRFTIQDLGGNVVRVELENTRVMRRNDARFLDTSFFPSAVAMVAPSTVGTSYVVDITLRERVPYQQRIEGDMLAIDFERPAGDPAAPAARAAPGELVLDAPAGEAPAEADEDAAAPAKQPAAVER